MANEIDERKALKEISQRIRFRIILIGAVCCLIVAGLLVRVGYIKYSYGSEYERRAVIKQIINRTSLERDINPERGFILDRNKQSLAAAARVYTIILDVTVLDTVRPTLNSDPKRDTLNALHEVLGIDMAVLENYFAKDKDGKLIKPNNYLQIARGVSGSDAMKLKDQRCVYIESDSRRVYNDPFLAPQVIGFLRGDSAWGLENFYGLELRGEPGRFFRMYDTDNNPMMEEISPIDGYWLVTTLDNGIQRIAQEAVNNAAKMYPCEHAAMIIMNPNTCEIYAMAQYPSFSAAEPDNIDLYTGGDVFKIWEELNDDQKLNAKYGVWINYHVTKTFEPGSIFKPITMAAALEENVVNPAIDTFYCGGHITILDTTLTCWNKNGHGGQTLIEALANSCNVAMVNIAARMGREMFFKYRSDFGFGEKTDIDLPGEASVSSPSVMYPLSQLNPVELATSSFGQGFNTTSVQAVTAFSALINGGNLMRPYIVSQIIDSHGNIIRENRPTLVRKVISAETSDFLRFAMQTVVSPGGTGWRAIVDGYNIGGKTGTAQQGRRDLDEWASNFVAYIPVENPEYVILAIIDKPDARDTASASYMMKEAMEALIKYKNIRPGTEESITAAIRNNLIGSETMNDYTGMQLAAVTHNLNNKDIDYTVVGSGIIVKSHVPAAGQPMPQGTPVYLYLDTESIIESEMTYVPDLNGLYMEEAEQLIIDARLTPITFREKITQSAGSNIIGEPVSYNPGQSGSVTADQSAKRETVYKQYPAPGSYVQKGTEIKIRVR